LKTELAIIYVNPAIPLSSFPTLQIFIINYTTFIAKLQTFIKPAGVQINLEAKSKPGGQNGLI
jgi:hypothetical protein